MGGDITSLGGISLAKKAFGAKPIDTSALRESESALRDQERKLAAERKALSEKRVRALRGAF